MKEQRTLTIGLLWHSANSTNLGVGALTVSQIAILRGAAADVGHSVRFKILGWRDPEPNYVKGPDIEIVSLRAKSLLLPNGLYAAVKDCDIVLDISAGDSFADIYGAQRFVYNILAKINVVAARRPLVLSPQTVGPFKAWWAKKLAGLMMQRAQKIVTRDRLSSDYLGEMGLSTKCVEATDVAIRLPYEFPEAREKSKIRVGLNVSGLLFNGGYSRDNMFSLETDYKRIVHSLCNYFTTKPEIELHLVGHVNSLRHKVEDDYRVCEQLARRYQSSVLAPRFENPSMAKTYIATMDFFAGARMHACIAAFSSGVPVLPMAYSRKFAGLFGTLGYNHLADCKTQGNEEVFTAVTKAYESRVILKKDLEVARKQADQKLQSYEKLLRKILVNAASKAK